jgi:hypothetical protein
MNLIGQAFKSPFQLVTSFVVYFSRIFYNAGARKGRYLSYLRAELEKNLDVLTESTAETSKARQKPIVTMPPSPVATRWNSWFLCVSYHNKYFKYYKKFFEAEMQLTNTPPESVEELHNMLQSISKWQELKACLAFLSQKATTVLSYIDIFQTRRPLTVKTFDHLEDLQIFFATNQQLPDEAFADIMEDTDEISLLRQREMRGMFQSAFDLAQAKLQKYMDGAQPSMEFLKQIRVLNPSRVSILSKIKREYTAIPLFDDVPDAEFVRYVDYLAPQAVQRSGGLPIDLDNFWLSVADRVPMLANIAKRYVNAVVSSADAERSFSLYNLILDCRRRSLCEASLKYMCFLYCNERVKCGNFEDSYPADDHIYSITSAQ